ncbi:hypothetical protein LJC35_04180 [Parabacteroides sp. OttesenSCG-928-N08]|nr:hypothetical protein [Parabacteroides sp. OttesenSCG-928-N08]
MKKIIYLLLMLPLIAMLGGCSEREEIVFDHEQPQFEIKENAILLEVIMPVGSILTHEYYITGAFNGGEEAIGNPEWKLEAAPGNSMKWGIYLLPSSFQDGKTLADGFTFYSTERGKELSALGEEVLHQLDAAVGTRTNVWVSRWERTGEEAREFVRIFVDDQSGWEALAMHYWGADDSEGVTGTDWPGLQPAGVETINGVDYTYFDLPKELNGKTINTIFNNNGAGKQFDAMFGLLVEADVYVAITDGGFELIDPNDLYKGFTVYVEDNSGWDALALYAWGDVEPAGWPGLQPAGTKNIDGVAYTYFQWGEENNGMSVNLIFNNNGAGEQFDAVSGFVIDRDIYLRITNNSFEEITPNAPFNGHYLYVDNQTGWEGLALHYWGDEVTGTDWPGLSPAGTKEVNGVAYTYFKLPEELNDKSINTIFNNAGAGAQIDGAYIMINKDYYFRITAESCEEVDPESHGKSYTLYIDNQTGWDAIALYAWGEAETPGWPGLQPAGTKEMGGVTYTYFDMPSNMTNKAINPIFNNNGNGVQIDAEGITLDRDYYYRLHADNSYEQISFTIYVDNQAGWDAIALYAWGEAETPGWPGLQPASTKEVNGVTYTCFEMPTYMTGKAINPIFNNNGGGVQIDAAGVTLLQDLYYQIHADNSYEQVTP